MYSTFNYISKTLCGLIAFSCCTAHAQTIQKINDSVLETISKADEIPGLKSDEFSTLRAGIIQRWNQLFESGSLVVTATDQETRPYFVAIQGVVEHVLSAELNKGVTSAIGIIHTPMPATPLCTKGEVSQELVDPTIAADPLRLFTVKARATIVRDYLYKGGDLHIVYPKDGLFKRNVVQQQTYLQELENHPVNLFDAPLECQEIDPEIIGATYFFKTDDGKKYIFAIKMTQANNPLENGQFGLWFGPADHPAVQERVSKVLAFLAKYGHTIVTP